MRTTLLPVLALLSGCTTTFDPKTPVRCIPEPVSAAPVPEKHVVINGPRPWAAEEVNIPSATLHLPGELFAELPMPWRTVKLAAGAVGYLDGAENYQGVRAVVTHKGIRKIAEPNELTQFCTSQDGANTFLFRNNNIVYRTGTFDGPATAIGKKLGGYDRNIDERFLVADKSTLFYANCKSGTVERVTGFDRVDAYPNPYIERTSDVVTVIRDSRANQQICYVRLGSSTNWEEIANCHNAEWIGKYVRVMVQTTGKNKKTSAACAFVIDPEGKKISCNDPIPPVPRAQPTPPEERFHFHNARFVGKTLMAVPSDKGLYVVPVQGTRADLKELTRSRCEPLSSAAPVFRCIGENQQKTRVVSVKSDGTLKQELELPKVPKDNERSFFSSTDGGLAIGGECDGSLGDAACVRQPDGTWKTIHFAADLVSALHRTAPGTLLVPTASGDLFVGTGASENLLGGGPISILVYKADKGVATRIEKVPTWILGDMAGLGGLIGSLLGQHSMRAGPSLVWRSADVLSAWPLSRSHPAFGTPENCGFDIALDGATDANCVQGKLIADGRFGLWEKKQGSLLETRDAGQTWTPVSLPEGTDTQNISCTAIGCRIGPYFRRGWGN